MFWWSITSLPSTCSKIVQFVDSKDHAVITAQHHLGSFGKHFVKFKKKNKYVLFTSPGGSVFRKTVPLAYRASGGTQDLVHSFSQFEHPIKFCRYDLNHCLPGQARFYCFPIIHHFLTHIVMPWSLFTEFSSAYNLKQTSQSPSLKHRMYFLWLQLFFVLGEIMAVNSMSFINWKNNRTFLCAEVFTDAFSCLFLWKIIEINKSNEF